MASTTTREQVKIGRVTVALTNTGKVLFTGDGITKGDLIGYYQAAAEQMLPSLRDRPLAMARYPDGITGERIFQKNVGRHFPDWIPRVEVGKQDGQLCQVICTKAADLVYLANQACIEFHPFLSRVGRPSNQGEPSRPDQLHRPDMLIFDLDPPDNGHFAAVRVDQFDHFFRCHAQLGIDLCLVVAMHTAQHEFGTTADEGLIFLTPLDKFRVACGEHFDLLACHLFILSPAPRPAGRPVPDNAWHRHRPARSASPANLLDA